MLVREYILCSSSPFFSAAFVSNFREGVEQTMNFSEEDLGIFDVFTHPNIALDIILSLDSSLMSANRKLRFWPNPALAIYGES